MVRDLRPVRLRIRADARDAVRDTRQARRALTDFERGLKTSANSARILRNREDRLIRSTRGLGRAAATAGRALRSNLAGIGVLIGGLSLAAVLRESIQATGEQEQALAQVEARLKSTGREAEVSLAQVAAVAARLQSVTTFGDEGILRSQGILLSFANIATEHLERTTEAVLDLATGTQTDLRSAVVQLGKALDDPITGLDGLSRSGTKFSESQKVVIRELAETNRLAEAQGLVLDEITKQYGGAARAARQTLAGAFTALGNAFGDLFEADNAAGARQLRREVESLIDVITDPQTVAQVRSLIELMLELTGAAIRGLRLVSAFITTVRESGNIGDDEQLGRNAARLERLLESEQAIRGRLAGLPAQATALRGVFEKSLAENLASQRRLEALILAGRQSGFTDALPPAPRPARDRAVTLPGVTVEAARLNSAQLVDIAEQGRLRIERFTLSSIERVRAAEARQIDEIFRLSDPAGGTAAETRRALIATLEAAEAEVAQIRERASQAAERQAQRTAQAQADAAAQAADAVRQSLIEQKEAAEAEYAAMLRASETWLDGVRRGLNEYSQTVMSASEIAREAIVGSFRRAEDAVARFVETGKFSFGGFVRSVLADLSRLTTSRFFGIIAGRLGSFLTPGVSPLGPTDFEFSAPVAHSGARIGAPGGVSRSLNSLSQAAETFAGARRYHEGGRVGGLRAGERAIIAQDGETVIPRGQGINPPAVRIEFVNRGTPQREVNRDVRFDGREWVIGIVTEDLVLGGRIARGIENQFGAQPAVT